MFYILRSLCLSGFSSLCLEHLQPSTSQATILPEEIAVILHFNMSAALYLKLSMNLSMANLIVLDLRSQILSGVLVGPMCLYHL